MSAALPNKDDKRRKKEERFKRLPEEERHIVEFNSKYSKKQLDCMQKLHLFEIKLKELKYLEAPSSIIKRQTTIVQEREDGLKELNLTLNDYMQYCAANFMPLSESEIDTYLRSRCLRWVKHISEFMKRKDQDPTDLFITAPCKKMITCCGPLCKLHQKMEDKTRKSK